MASDVTPGRLTFELPFGNGTTAQRYLPVAEHGLIGDLHSVALVGTDGTIDWYCCRRFDSPSVFAAILDADRGRLVRESMVTGQGEAIRRKPDLVVRWF